MFWLRVRMASSSRRRHRADDDPELMHSPSSICAGDLCRWKFAVSEDRHRRLVPFIRPHQACSDITACADISTCETAVVNILSRICAADLCRWKCVSKDWRCRLVPSAICPRLPDEGPLSNVLSRLPPADLCRCKSVCKDWNRRLIPSLIAARPQISFFDGLFGQRFFTISEHDGAVDINVPYLPSPSQCSSLFQRHFGDRDNAMLRAALNLPRHSRDFPWGCTPEEGRFLGVCNGMIFASRGWQKSESPSSFITYFFSVRKYVVLNPVTGQVSTIPPPPHTNASSFNFLAFDPRVSSHHYKIISIKDDDDFQMPYLYSSVTAQWRSLKKVPGEMPAPPSEMEPLCQLSYCLNGVAYREAGDATTASPAHAQKNIMAFDVKEERLFWFTTPVIEMDENQESGIHRLGESEGYLMYAFHVRGESLFTWRLSSDHLSWTCTHKINLKDVAIDPLLRSRCCCISFYPLDANAIYLGNFNSCVHIFDLHKRKLCQINKDCAHMTVGSLLTFVCPR